jgi:hypothetical protein
VQQPAQSILIFATVSCFFSFVIRCNGTTSFASVGAYAISIQMDPTQEQIYIYMAQKELQRLWTRVETLCLTLDTEPDSNVESRRQYCRDRRPMSAPAGSVGSSCHCRANLSRGPIGVDTVPTQCSSLELCRVRAMDSVCSVSMRFTYDSSSDVFFHRGGNCAVY